MTSLGVTTLKQPGGQRCARGRWLVDGSNRKQGLPCPNKPQTGSVYCQTCLADALARLRAHWARAQGVVKG